MKLRRGSFGAAVAGVKCTHSGAGGMPRHGKSRPCWRAAAKSCGKAGTKIGGLGGAYGQAPAGAQFLAPEMALA